MVMSGWWWWCKNKIISRLVGGKSLESQHNKSYTHTQTHRHTKGGFQRDFRSAIFQDFSFIFFIEGYYFLAKRFENFSSASFTPNEPPPPEFGYVETHHHILVD